MIQCWKDVAIIYKACDLETGELSVVFEKRGDFPTARLETEEDSRRTTREDLPLERSWSIRDGVWTLAVAENYWFCGYIWHCGASSLGEFRPLHPCRGAEKSKLGGKSQGALPGTPAGRYSAFVSLTLTFHVRSSCLICFVSVPSLLCSSNSYSLVKPISYHCFPPLIILI